MFPTLVSTSPEKAYQSNFFWHVLQHYALISVFCVGKKVALSYEMLITSYDIL